MPDSTIHPLAYIKPQSKNDSLRFVISKTASRSNDLVLNWGNINLPAELTIWKGIQNKETKGYSGGEYAETTINEVVSSKTGEYVIHRSFFEDSLNIATYVKVSLNHREFGLINPSLLVGSDVIYDSKLEGTIDMVE